jgi:NADPH-dependent curcumin reductase CurA
VVISAAAGEVGSLAGQIARILGARVVGIAGGPENAPAAFAGIFRGDAHVGRLLVRVAEA